MDALHGAGFEPLGFSDLESRGLDEGQLAPGEVLAGRPFSGLAFVGEDDGHRRVPVTAHALAAAAAALEGAALLELFRQPLEYYQQSLGVAYPYDKCDIVFVPGYPGLAFGALCQTRVVVFVDLLTDQNRGT